MRSRLHDPGLACFRLNKKIRSLTWLVQENIQNTHWCFQIMFSHTRNFITISIHLERFYSVVVLQGQRVVTIRRVWKPAPSEHKQASWLQVLGLTKAEAAHMSIECRPGQEQQEQPLLPVWTFFVESLCVLGCVFVKRGLIARARVRDNLLEVCKTQMASTPGWCPWSLLRARRSKCIPFMGPWPGSGLTGQETSNERRFSP